MKWLVVLILSVPAGAQVQDLRTLDFASIPDWHQLLPGNQPFISEGHGNEPVRVYFNDPGLGGYNGTCELPFPPGTIMAKSFVGDEDEDVLHSKVVFLMQKREAGYDPENGDWEYGVAQRQEDKSYRLTHQGIIQGCIPCHKAYEEWDYALSVQRYREYQGFWGAFKLMLGL